MRLATSKILVSCLAVLPVTVLIAAEGTRPEICNDICKDVPRNACAASYGCIEDVPAAKFCELGGGTWCPEQKPGEASSKSTSDENASDVDDNGEEKKDLNELSSEELKKKAEAISFDGLTLKKTKNATRDDAVLKKENDELKKEVDGNGEEKKDPKESSDEELWKKTDALKKKNDDEDSSDEDSSDEDSSDDEEDSNLDNVKTVLFLFIIGALLHSIFKAFKRRAKNSKDDLRRNIV